jgi:hypothetical protein
MITVRTSPQYVNRVRQDWMANGGVYGDGGISALVPSNDPFAQLGPTLDLTFAGNPTDLLTASTTAGYTLDTYFTPETYQIAVPYAIWEDGVGLAQKTFAQIVTFSRTSGATWFNAAGNLVGVDFSVTSVTIGTGSVTFTLDATAGVNRSWAAGDSVLISQQSNSANNMTGTVTSYTASTQVLVVNVTSTGGSGTITSWRVSSLMPRFDYNPSTLAAQGLLIEESRTNSIRNNTMVGAVAGTPGTLPTNGWAYFSTAGLTTSVIGTGTQNGINYIDLRLNGTTTNTFIVLAFDSVAAAASSGQVWTESFWVSLVGGSTANITSVNVNLRQTGGATPTFDIPFTPTATFTRVAGSGTLAAGATGATAALAMFCNNGAAIDITLRIGLPQLEQGAFATSVIPTTTTALTRAADVASVNTLSPWYNASAGTVYAEFASYGSASAFPTVWQLDDGTTQNLLSGYVFTNILGTAQRTLNVSQGDLNTAGAAINWNNNTKMGYAYATNDSALSGNGSALTGFAVDNTVSIPTVTAFRMGGKPLGAQAINGWLRRITYYPRRLSNADLQTITT